jgi:hypothetical protein
MAQRGERVAAKEEAQQQATAQTTALERTCVVIAA